MNSHRVRRLLMIMGVVCAAVGPAGGQTQPPGFVARDIVPPEQNGMVPLGPDSSGDAEQWSELNGQRILRNVTRPGLTVVAARAPARREAVLIVPGGGLRFVSIDNEGLLVARHLADAGYTCFVLRYRTIPTPRQPEAFAAQFTAIIAETLSQPPAKRGQLPAWPAAVEDARSALRLIRQSGQPWDVRPDRVHFIGFSAGAWIGQRLLEGQDIEALPNSVAMLYGPMADLAMSRRPPPLFVALADDDVLFGRQGFGLVEAWRRHGQRVETHVYERGGHGFGMPAQGTTSDGWLSQYVTWLRAQ